MAGAIERVGPVTGSRQDRVLGRVLEQVSWSVAVFRRYSRDRIGAVNAHSVAVLPVCYLLSRRLGARLVDAHELETETIASRGLQRAIFKVIERLLITRCDAMFVVSDSIAQWYRQRYPALRPVVIRNIPSVAGAGRRRTCAHGSAYRPANCCTFTSATSPPGATSRPSWTPSRRPSWPRTWSSWAEGSSSRWSARTRPSTPTFTCCPRCRRPRW